MIALPTLTRDELLAKWQSLTDSVAHFSPWTTAAELAWLAELASQCDQIAEVGSYKGKSAKVLATACPGFVWCIDRFQDHTEPDFRRNLAPEIASGKVTLLAMESADGAAFVADRSLAAVFIDASHSEWDVARDIDLWLPKIRKGGILCGHDYERSDPDNGVKKAVHSKLAGFVLPIDTIWAWEVPL